MSKSLPFPHEKIFLLLSQCQMLTRKFAEKELRTLGITVAEYALLRVIENHPRPTASEAGKRLFATAPSIAQLVKHLKKKGLIESGSDATDIRRQPLSLTAKGKTDVVLGRQAIQNALQRLNLPQNGLKSLEDELSSLFSSLTSYGD